MERLTTNKDVSEMGMFELAHNSCYCKDGVARYRDFENDMDARDLARELAWMLADIELSSYDDNFDEEMLENLQYDITKEPIGLIALFYRNLWAMADLREKLKEYEDLEEQGLLLRLPCKAGDIVYKIVNQRDNYDDIVYQIVSAAIFELSMIDKIGKTVFLTKAEAEQKLKEIQNNLKDGEEDDDNTSNGRAWTD